MTMTIDITPELENWLQEAAREQGQDARMLAAQILEERLPDWNRRQWERFVRPSALSRDERLSLLRQMGSTVDPAVPPLSDEATRRETMYNDEGL